MTMEETLRAKGLTTFSSPDLLKKAYRCWLVVAHPDKGGNTNFFVEENKKWLKILPSSIWAAGEPGSELLRFFVC